MKFEVLKQSHLKRNIIIGVVAVLIISAIILNFTRAKYRTTQSIPLVNGTINYSLADLNIVAITVDGEASDTIPKGNYELTENSYCTVNGEENSNVSLNYDVDTQTLQVIPFTTKGTKCYLDFTKKVSAGEQILAGKDIQTRDDFSIPITNTTTEIVYQTTDWLGTSYYFAGAPTDNWVRFGGFYWRIVRVNGDGSVRLIYNGTSTSTTGSGTMINSSQSFNSNEDVSYLVGLKYTPDEQHGLTINSPILDLLQTWYDSSGLNNYSNQIDTNAGFCSDREILSGYIWSNKPDDTMRYAAFGRIVNNGNPSLQCSISDIVKGAIGLITADEVLFAGGIYNLTNTSYYMYNSQYYWTMTPSYYRYFYGSYILSIDADGGLGSNWVSHEYGVRPVINLSADVTLTGSGTATDPYVVS